MKKTALKGMRGVMALAILLSHCGYLTGYKKTEMLGTFFLYLYGAVTFFFVLSGYFFYYTRKTEPFKAFVLRKIQKIYPLHILTLVCSFSLILFRGEFSIKEDLFRFLFNLLLLQSWIPQRSYYFSFNAVSWFLSSLLMCYCAAWWLYKRKIPVYWIVGGGYALQVLLCIFLKEPHHWLLYISPTVRIADFCLGICICKSVNEQCHKNLITYKGKWIYTVLEVVSIGLFIEAILLAKRLIENWTYNCIWIIPSALIVVVFSIEEGVISRLLASKVFQRLGEISMELFMTHKFIINNLVKTFWFINLGERNAGLSLLIIIFLCLGLAVFTRWVITEIGSAYCMTFVKKAREEEKR